MQIGHRPRFRSCDNLPALRNPFLSRATAVTVLVSLLVCFQVQAAAQSPAPPPIALIGIPTEIAPVEARVQNPVNRTIQGFVFTTGTIEGTRVVVARSGVGKVNAAIVATLLLDHFSPSAVLFTGTAGAVDEKLNPGDVVIGTGVGYHDFGSVTERGFARSPTRDPVTGQLDLAFFPADPKLLTAARAAAKTTALSRGPRTEGDAPKFQEGLIVTGDAVIAQDARRKDLRNDLKAAAVEMEGAAVAQACARYKVPVIVLRGITDRADSNVEGSYRAFIQTSSRNAADLAIATIRELVKMR
jgi:adenosylhomocysteine nucleosidase